MGYMKRAIALMLALVMTLCLAVSASAATSSQTSAPTVTPAPTATTAPTATAAPTERPVNPGYGTDTKRDNNSQDHQEQSKSGLVVISDIVSDDKGAAVSAIVAVINADSETEATISTARGVYNDEIVPITQIGGDPKDGVFNRKAGTYITAVTVDSSVEEFMINTGAFQYSNVKTLTVNTKSVRIKKNAFKNTNKKNLTINLTNATKAADVKVGKGSFTGLNKKAKLVVSKKMSKAQYKKLVTKLRKKGFKGKIVRK